MLFPPAFNCSNRELGCVMADADADKSFIVLQIINLVRNRIAQFLLWEAMSLNANWVLRATQDSAGIRQISRNFLSARSAETWVSEAQ